MTSPYRASAVPAPEPPRRWTYEELVRVGGFYDGPLIADRWTGYALVPCPRHDGPAGVSEQQHHLVEGARFEIMTDDEWWRCGRVRPATLAELLWYGIARPEVFDETGHERLYACGSIAWRHWRIDGKWTRHVPYLSRCKGRVRLHRFGDIDVIPYAAAGKKNAYLCVR